jgi:hypothetical protein
MGTCFREAMMGPSWQQPSGYCLVDATWTRHGVNFMNEINVRQHLLERIVVRPNVAAT